MFKVGNYFLSGFLTFSLASGVAFSASQMKDFEISQCLGERCLKANGSVGFVASTGDLLSAKNVVVNFFEQEKLANHFLCADFKYDFLAKFITCDNRGKTDRKSLTINESFEVTIFKY